LPAETALLVGEPEPLSYDELQHTFARLLHGESWETRSIPKAVAKAGAWVQGALPADAFIRPWMIDLADDHYALDVRRARELLGWEPRRSLRDTLPKMIEALKRDPARWFEENGLEVPEGAGGSRGA
jgi:nucleoside-diphosphate-sugar epimerase